MEKQKSLLDIELSKIATLELNSYKNKLRYFLESNIQNENLIRDNIQEFISSLNEKFKYQYELEFKNLNLYFNEIKDNFINFSFAVDNINLDITNLKTNKSDIQIFDDIDSIVKEILDNFNLTPIIKNLYDFFKKICNFFSNSQNDLDQQESTELIISQITDDIINSLNINIRPYIKDISQKLYLPQIKDYKLKLDDLKNKNISWSKNKKELLEILNSI
ncbi:hypothetical protein [Campylobacter ureolyticus]|uniref:Uncharacterized protein n=1 Tax=Campylobacter ureolyticus TaxID=827 RepID=A0A9Q4PX81_9BACT|nr:hypothetical protein [Campylobacter ureolyticus]MCZ6104012.1 hypothetical protein [Campylobacter ureolyticus]MCZ6162326.1 hypothetical protein [Campylobacter ureolyticus]MCZ6171315.1 hypothetical protein [Campylobacter ureolyticus]